VRVQRCLAVAIGVIGCGHINFDPLGGDGTPLDTDHDGVPDDVDNCPGVANPDQDNEDGDALGDLCDPCPPIADAMDPGADRDGDGVGDACDPHPDTPGDRLALFEGFNRAPTTLTLVGAWTFANGRATVTGSLNELTAATTVSATPSETVSTRVTIGEMFGSDVARPIGVVHEFNKPTLDGIMCVFGLDPSNAQVYALASNATTGVLLPSVPTIASVGTSSTFSSLREANDYACSAQRLTTPLKASSNVTSNPNRVGLFSRSASASFDWLMVVTSP
jgi:hypothetical protein